MPIMQRGAPVTNGAGVGAWGSSGANKKREADVSLDLMEAQNDKHWDALGEQVDLLKKLSLDINSEVKSQNSLLDGMEGTFGGTIDMFRNTAAKIGAQILAPGSSHMYYLVGFIVFVFLVIYFLGSRKG